MLRIFTAFTFCLMSFFSQAAAMPGESYQQGKVTELRISSSGVGGNPTHFRLSGMWANQGCATVGYWAVDTDTPHGKSILSALLTAKTAGKNVIARNNLTGGCDLRGDMRDLIQLEVLD